MSKVSKKERSLLTPKGVNALAYHVASGQYGSGSKKFTFKDEHLTGAGKLLHQQVGGSAFTDFFTKTIPNAAKSVGSAIKSGATTIYNKALKPAGVWIADRAKQGYEEFKKRPLQFVGDLASSTGIPIVKQAGDFTSALGKKVGAGQSGGAFLTSAEGDKLRAKAWRGLGDTQEGGLYDGPSPWLLKKLKGGSRREERPHALSFG